MARSFLAARWSTLTTGSLAALLALSCATEPKRQAPPRTPQPEAPPVAMRLDPTLAVEKVEQVLSTNWCDRGPRTGRLVWSPVAGATMYEVDQVATDFCCDYQYKSWPDDRWLAGRRSVVTEPSTSDETVAAIYWRVRAVARSRYGPWTQGMWDCWIQ